MAAGRGFQPPTCISFVTMIDRRLEENTTADSRFLVPRKVIAGHFYSLAA